LHQFDLVPRDWRARKHFSDPSQCVPSGERDWKQYGLNAGCTRDGSKKFLVGVDARATALERNRVSLRPLQHLCDRLPNIFHVDWLQSHLAGAEHWIDREQVEELEDSGEKCIIRPKYDRRADSTNDRTTPPPAAAPTASL
jgi:hypothetical protein